eukprot:TRINITY_DN70850_c0_g1_i2.p1 TRINITY_DN70850_c0_g1~~TRINITY_DN70850_c0_g1_i2.p1  ORF type:complete len:400 (+),score=40.14 TRINITY_DN70850_c0_g1_i2:52-1200(+)
MMGKWAPSRQPEPPNVCTEPLDCECDVPAIGKSETNSAALDLEEALIQLARGIDTTTNIESLRSLRMRIIDDIVTRIGDRLNVLEEFSITVVTLAGASRTIDHVRPDETLFALVLKIQVELGIPERYRLHVCHGARVFPPTDYGTSLRCLGISSGAELTCVVGQSSLVPGMYAKICRLRNHVELNEHVVRIVSDSLPDRFEVVELISGQHYRVRRDNLEIVASTEPERCARTSGVDFASTGSAPYTAFQNQGRSPKVGDLVALVGLTTQYWCNGLTGEVVSVNEKMQRCSCRLADGSEKMVLWRNAAVISSARSAPPTVPTQQADAKALLPVRDAEAATTDCLPIRMGARSVSRVPCPCPADVQCIDMCDRGNNMRVTVLAL